MQAVTVGIIMGSDSDLPVMKAAAEILDHFSIGYELTIVSAHRTPGRMFEYAQEAHQRGLKVIIAGAGGAAHLPGMVASLSPLPVIGVPVKSSNSIDGWDSVLSHSRAESVGKAEKSNWQSRLVVMASTVISARCAGIGSGRIQLVASL